MHREAPSTLVFLVGLALTSCAAPAPLPPAAPGSSGTPPPSTTPSPDAPAAIPDRGTPALASPDANGPSEPDRDVDEASRGRVIAALSQHLDDEYAFAEMGARLAQALREGQARGVYASAVTASAFSRQLTQDLQDVSKDRHLAVFFHSGVSAPERAAGAGPRHEGLDGAIHRIEVFPGNIGYLQVDGNPPLPFARSAIDAAFAFLRDTDALILDCRGNGGGDPHTGAYYLSYLTQGAPFVVNTFHARDGGVQESWTTDLGQLSYGESKPVWVLTSSRTFSGGEELAYGLQAMRRARVVGEVTGGGANLVHPVPLGEGFVARMPSAHPVNPFTNTNWEGRGVQPDVPVPAAQALDVALAAARAHANGAEDKTPALAPLPPRKRPEQLMLVLDGPGSGALRGPNLVTNGDFARGLAPWAVTAWTPGRGVAKPSSLKGGTLCTHAKGGEHLVIGWPEESRPDEFALRAGVPYRLSFRISASGRLPLRAEVGVGHRLPPYQAVANAEVPLDAQPRLLHVDFRSDHDEPRAGIAVRIEAPPSAPDPGSDVCVDDFVLRELVAKAP